MDVCMHKSKSTHPSVWFVTGPNLAASHAHACNIDIYIIYIYIYIYIYTHVQFVI